MSTRGRHLVASPSLNDPNFEFTVVFMLEHSDEGALGVVLTRPSELPVTDMFDGWVDHAAAPSVVFRGGPVSLSSVIALGVAASAGPSGGFNPIAAGIGTVDLDTDPAELIALQGSVFRGLCVVGSWTTRCRAGRRRMDRARRSRDRSAPPRTGRAVVDRRGASAQRHQAASELPLRALGQLSASITAGT